MIIQYGTAGFSDEWLEFVKEDPVHPSISIERQIGRAHV